MRDPICLLLLALAWGGNAAYAFGAFGGAFKFWAPLPVAVGMIGFVLWHGFRALKVTGFLRFLGIVFFVGWSFETISVITGIPFGTYHYTAAMAPFIGHVPVFVLPAYALMGYLSWRMAALVALRLGGMSRNRLAMLAAFFMVLWDLSMDPLRATVEARWIWLEGGAYFGIPLSNYLGWFGVTFVMFRWFAQRAPQAEIIRGDLFVPLFFLSFAVEYLLNPITGQGVGQLAFGGAASYGVQQIYLAIAVIAGLTLLPVALFAFLLLLKPRAMERLLSRLSARTGIRE